MLAENASREQLGDHDRAWEGYSCSIFPNTHFHSGCEGRQAFAICAQGRTDSGHLYVMDPTDILSTGARGFGVSPLPSGVNEAGVAGAPLQQPRVSLT